MGEVDLDEVVAEKMQMEAIHTLYISCSLRSVNLTCSQHHRRGGRKSVGSVMGGHLTKGVRRRRGWSNRNPIDMGKTIPVGAQLTRWLPQHLTPTSTIRMKEGRGICGNVSVAEMIGPPSSRRHEL